MVNELPLKIAIFGAGSIGCYLGGLLAHGGGDVIFVGRERFRDAIAQNGLKLTHYERSEIDLEPHSVRFELDPSSVGDADVILVSVKSQGTDAAAETLAKHAKPDALIISFQNGVSNAEELSRHLKTQTVLGGVVPFNVTGTGPGGFHCGTEGDLIVQAHEDAHLRELSNIFEDAGQSFKTVPDIRAVQWGKLIVNLNNALNALWGGMLRAGLMQRSYRRVLAAMMTEAINVIEAAGENIATFGKASPQATIRILKLPNWLFTIIMNRILRIDESARSSMLDDLEMGRTAEIDFLQGEIIRLAEASGQNAPINTAVYQAIRDAFDKGESPKMSGAEMLTFLKT